MIRAVPESDGADRRRTDLAKTVAKRSYRPNAAQGQPVDLRGYCVPGPEFTGEGRRPSATINNILASSSSAV
jgi:hypothetical protein